MELLNDETLTEINDGLSIIQKKDGLTFGTDAYLLSAYIRRQPRAKAIDLGSGTGVISLLALAGDKFASCTAVEIQKDFADIIERNAEVNSLSDRLRALLLDVRELRSSMLGGQVDIVFSNPPYMKLSGDRNDSDRKYIARHEVMGGIGDFCRAAGRVLKTGGLFYTVWRPDRLCDLISELRAAELEPKRMTFVHSRAELEPCLVLCESKKGASSGMYITPPLIMFSDQSNYTSELKQIYEKGDFNEYYKRP